MCDLIAVCLHASFFSPFATSSWGEIRYAIQQNLLLHGSMKV